MKHIPLALIVAAFAALIAGVIVWIVGHPAHSGLHENLDPHPSGLATIFFYWWGGIMAALSPLFYVWMWRKAREQGRDVQDPF